MFSLSNFNSPDGHLSAAVQAPPRTVHPAKSHCTFVMPLPKMKLSTSKTTSASTANTSTQKMFASPFFMVWQKQTAFISLMLRLTYHEQFHLFGNQKLLGDQDISSKSPVFQYFFFKKSDEDAEQHKQ